MYTHLYESYTRPHMDDLQRHAARHRLAASVTVAPRVRLGRLLVRVGERLLRNPGTSATLNPTTERKAIS